jgi:hypothetical protein
LDDRPTADVVLRATNLFIGLAASVIHGEPVVVVALDICFSHLRFIAPKHLGRRRESQFWVQGSIDQIA